MATYSTLGVGAGLDLQTLLSKLMDAERVPVKLLEAKVTATNTKVSTYGALQSRLDALKSAADTLRFESSLVAKTVSSTDSAVATATAAATALNGSVELEVTQLASAQKSFTSAFSSGQTFSAGELTFSINGVAGDPIPITEGSTLQQIGAQINAANAGVKATVVTAADATQRLVLSGEKSGADQSFTLNSTVPGVAPAGGGTAVTLGDFDTATDGLARRSASDALMTVEGIGVRSSTNVFNDAIQGITITAFKASTPGAPATTTLSVSNNNDKIVSAVQAFVDAFNAVNSNVTANSGFDTATKSGKAFSGDFAVRSVMDDLRLARTSEPTGVATSIYKTLSDLGVTVQQNGSLSLDSTKLKEKLGASPGDVVKTLNAYGAAFSEAISSTLSSGGAFASRIEGLNSSVRRYQDSVAALEVRLAQTERRYRAQFTALDKYVSSMQSTGSYLSQQLSSLQKSA